LHTLNIRVEKAVLADVYYGNNMYGNVVHSIGAIYPFLC